MNNITVINKDDNKIYKVYDIVYNKNGYPHFLIYKDGQWIRIKAKHFRPMDAIEKTEARDIVDIVDSWYDYFNSSDFVESVTI